MSAIQSPGSIDVAAEPRASHRYAKAPHLWALGVGAVISGDFFGWQAALIAGFDGLLIILAIVTVLYVLLSFSIAELSATVPANGGPYVFALHAIGPRAAFVAGLAESLKVVITGAVIVTGISSYLAQLLSIDTKYGPIWWAIFYAIFVGLNAVGVEMTFRVQAITTVLSVLMLLVFYVGAATKISYDDWVVARDMQYTGWDGAVKGFSFALWFFLGIEELPLAVEETIEPSKNMPRGLVSSILSLTVFAFATVVFNSMISPGADMIAASSSPLLVGYQTVFGDNSTTSGFTWILIVGLIASFHSFIFCMGQLLYAIARDGFLPQVLTIRHKTRDTAYMALIIGSVIGYIVTVILHFAIGDTRLGSVLINLALIGAVVSYSLQLASFIRLRVTEPERERPYRSPFGVPGAVVCIALCVVALFSIIYSGTSSYEFLASVIGGIVYFILGGVYFFYRVQPRIGGNALSSAKEIRENLLSSAAGSKV